MGNLFGMIVNMSVPEPEDIGGYDFLLLADLLAPAATALGKLNSKRKLLVISSNFDACRNLDRW